MRLEGGAERGMRGNNFRCIKLIIMEAKRYNEGKPKWHLVHLKSLEGLVRVLEYGLGKYEEEDNWMKDMNADEILNSLTRHLVQINAGEKVDSESGLDHIDHILANAMFYKFHTNKDETI